MKNLLQLSLLFTFVLVSCSTFAQVDGTIKEKIRAKQGDKMLLVINYVKAEVKEDYMKFMEEVFFDAVVHSNTPLLQEQHRKTRWLLPQGQNEDQSWTFVYLMDPLVEEGDYQFPSVLQEKYTKEKVEALMKQYDAYLAAPPKIYPLIQSKY